MSDAIVPTDKEDFRAKRDSRPVQATNELSELEKQSPAKKPETKARISSDPYLVRSHASRVLSRMTCE